MHAHELAMIFVSIVVGSIIGSYMTLFLVYPMGQYAAYYNYNPFNGDQRQQYASVNVTSTLQDHIFSILNENEDSVVHIKVKKEFDTLLGTQVSEVSGSGFVIRDSGYIVTNGHVVSDATEIIVIFNDGSELEATIRGTDPLNDVAVIKVNPSRTGLKAVRIGNSSTIRKGQIVVAIGSPFQLQNTVTMGIVSATDRTLTSEGGFRIEDVIQTDAAINPGNSGGPLLSLNGEVIGINTAIISQSGGSEGIGFAIPINTAERIFSEIIETGKLSRPWLGITGTDVGPNLVKLWNLKIDSGVLIFDFTETSPAREAGLRETISRPGKNDFVIGDIITGINGEKIGSNSDLLNTLLKYRPGDTVSVKVYRDGDFLTFSIKLGERPEGM